MCQAFEINGEYYIARPSATRDSYVVFPGRDPDHHITTVVREGRRYVALGYPGKKWMSIEQAVTYAVTHSR